MQSDGIKANQSLGKALQIIEFLATQDQPARLNDIGEAVGIPSSTVLRFLTTFIERGYVKKHPDTSRYYLTLKIVDLGKGVQDRFSIRSALAPYLNEVSARLEESASLCIEEEGNVVYLDVVEGPAKTLQTMQRIGRVAPMYCTGSGKILLCDRPQDVVNAYFKDRELRSFTRHTLTNREDVLAELERVRSLGFGLDAEECEYGVRCVAVPIRDYTGRTIASISISAPTTRLDSARQEEAIEILKEISLRASEELGYHT